MLCSVAWGQVTTGTISGTVKDVTGAVVPGVEVIVRNVETGASRAVTTNERGRYIAPQLAVGNYEVSARAEGFQMEVRRGITLTIGREAVVDFALTIGSVAETVEVTGEAPLVETTTSTVSGLVDTRQMREIPLNARSFMELVPLQAGAVFNVNANETAAVFGFGVKLSVAGGRMTSNSFQLDGTDMNDSTGSAGSVAGTLAGVETVREFRVIANAYDAQYGKHTGGVVSAVTKSGTNEIHGSLFEFLRNSKLDANDFFNNAANLPKKAYRRNQFGFSLGGPARKDKTFFFGSFEGLRESLPSNPEYIVPSVRLRQEVPTGVATLQGVSYTVDPKIVPYLLAWPLPTGAEFLNPRSGLPDGTAQRREAQVRDTDHNYWTGRMDHRFSDSDLMFLRYTYDQGERITPGLTVNNIIGTPNHYATLEHTRIFSPALLGKVTLAFTRVYNTIRDDVREGFTYPHPFCTDCVGFDGSFDAPGRITGTGFTNMGGSNLAPVKRGHNTYQVKTDMYRTSGRHSLKFGVHFQRYQANWFSNFQRGGTLSFASTEDFVRGRLNQVSIVIPGSDSIRGWRQSLFGLYLHDDLNVRPGLTLNLGVRYEFITTPYEVNGKLANIRDLSEPWISTVGPATTDIGDPFFLNPSLRNFAPRVGFAWSGFGDSKTVVRGGAGIFYDQILAQVYAVPGSFAAPFYSYVDLFARDFVGLGGIDFPSFFYTQRDQLGKGGGRPEFRPLQFNINQPYVMKWSLDVERELGSQMSVGIGYSGTRGVHLMRANQHSNYTPSEIRADGRRYLLIDQPMRNTKFNRMYTHITDGTSIYHGLRFTLQKRASRGLQFQTSYTWSKSLDDGSSEHGGGDYAGASQSNGDLYGGLKWKGLSSFDMRHSFFTNFVYDLPGHNLTGAVGQLLGGWSVAGVVRLTSGPPLTISAATPRNGLNTLQFVQGSSVVLMPGGNNSPVLDDYRDHPNQQGSYFDLSQFLFPEFCFNTAARPNNCNGPSYVVHGNVGRNTMPAPGVVNVNFTVLKEFALTKLREGTNLQFRAEFFNLFNRPQYGNPSVSVFDNQGRLSATAGRINETRISTGLGPRSIQLGLRVGF
ncbi:MAG: TonB-dependent receptor [Acidobacteria bacterium]|nr:TonB-dependent receptor [Acidobacteriota bacterium]